MSKQYGLNELREMFLSFFESKEHLRLPSFSLIPQNDNSLLIINSGMAPMKPYFKGEQEPPRKRVCTCQKCIRTGDIENIGHTARHGTFFEMLGNFSFGDYFKTEAIHWSWEFLTSPQWVGLDPERLYPSVYVDDDEAFAIWRDEIGIAPERIFKFGKEDNFWEHGAGPCGPCSEIYYDRGEKYGCGKPDCTVGCDCDRYIEVWNNVFSQFDNDGHNNYSELKQKNIDTGMGLERLAVVSQDVASLFDVDTVMNITKKVTELTGASYEQSKKIDVSLRVITDHIRSAVFMISDGILPSNEGRGYVLRRLLRRASRHGKLLGVNKPFLFEVVDTVVHESECQYPELREKEDYIISVVKTEEENFNKTLDKGLIVFKEMLSNTDGKLFSGKDAFRLYDTFGFPLDLTKEMCEDEGLEVDDVEFKKLMEEQRIRAREARKALGDLGWAGEEFGKDIPDTEFIGYEDTACTSKILSILFEGKNHKELRDGEEGIIVLDKTVMYAQMGGQAGDCGVIKSDASVFTVDDVQKNKGGKFMHIGKLSGETLHVGDTVTVEYNKAKRLAVSRAHSATHMLQSALRTVLGSHVHQAGSLVESDYLRFDFTNNQAVNKEQLLEVEKLVNANILDDSEIVTNIMSIEDAKKSGATALFGEKYGDTVRVVNIGDYSSELCGGTHLKHSSQVGSFHIISESSVASGVRRIEAVTGYKTIEALYEDKNKAIAESNELKDKIKELKKQIETFKAKESSGNADSYINSAVEYNGKHVVLINFDGDANAMRSLGDVLRDKDSKIVAVIVNNGACLCVCGKDSGSNAVELIRALGKGGGKSESAMGKLSKEINIDIIKENL